MSKVLSQSNFKIKLRGLKVLRRLHPDQPESFAFSPENQKWAEAQMTNILKVERHQLSYLCYGVLKSKKDGSHVRQ